MKKGFTLIEILISLFFLTLVMTSFVSVVVISTRSFRASRALYLGSKIAEDGIELVVNKRDNNILCIKPGNCAQLLCGWKQGLLYTPGGSCNLQDRDWNVDAIKSDQLLAGNWFDDYNSLSRICVKPASQNKFGICTTETPITGNYNRKVTITDVPGLEAVNVQSTVTWTVNGKSAGVTMEEMLFGINGSSGGGGGSDLVGWWKMDEEPAIDASVIADSSGNGHNGTFFTGDGNTNKSVTGTVDEAINFDGVNDFITMSTAGILTSQATYSFWIKPVGSSWRAILGSGTNDEAIFIGPSNILYAPGVTSLGSAASFPQWTHVVVTWDGAFSKIYLNGNFDNQSSSQTLFEVKIIGSDQSGSFDEVYSGEIDDIRVYNRALLASEILNLYNGDVSDIVPPSDPTGLTAAAVSYSQINLSWTDSTDNFGVAGYKVERCQGSGCSSFTEIATPSSTTYSDTGLAPNTTYRYRVRATDAAGNLSGYSSVAAATTQIISCSATGTNAFYGCYYNSASPGAFTALAATRSDTAINFNWDTGSPDPAINSNLFSARWTGDFNFNAGDYIFTAISNDGIRFYIDNDPTPITFDQGNGWVDQSSAATFTATRTMTAVPHQIKVEYYENTGQASAQFSWVQPVTGLVGWWRLDDGIGSLTAADSSGNGNTGVLANGPVWTTAGQIDGALDFDGTNDRVNLGSQTSLDNLQQKTISLWVKYPSAGSIDIPDLVDKQDGGSSGWRLRLNSVINGSDLRLRFAQNFSSTSGEWSSNASTVPFDSWAHVAVTYNKTSTSNQPIFYVNGSPVGSSPITGPSGTASDDSAVNAYIGDRSASDNSFKGSIDDVRIYNGILSAAEIRTIYDLGGVPSVPVGLTATPASSSQINLSWAASTDNVGVTGYRVERCQDSGCSSFVQIATPLGNSYSDTGLSTGTSYRYRVRAYDAAGNNSDYSPTASATTQFIAGLVGWWKFDEGFGTSAADSSGNGHKGTLDLPTWIAGKVGSNALDFNGGWVHTPSVVTTATNNITMSVWAYWQGTSASSYLISNGIGGTDGYGLWLSDGGCGDGNKVTMILGGITCDALSSNYVMPTNEWVHLAVVRDSGTWKLYANGALVVTGGTSGPLTPTTRTYFGGLNGFLDDVLIYNRVLTQPEIQTLCDMGTGGCPGGGGGGDTTAPTVPGSFNGTVISSSQIDLSWIASTDAVGVTGYQIDRCTGAGCTSFVSVYTPIGSATAQTDTGLTANTLYRYRIRARDAVPNWSAYTAIIDRTTSGGPSGGIASVGSLGTTPTTDITADTSFTLTPTATLEVGNIGILTIAKDNESAADGNTTECNTPTDSVGNTYTKLREFTNGQGAADAGATVCVFFTKATNTLTTSGTVTMTVTTASVKAASFWEFTVGAGNTIQVASGGAADLAEDSDSNPAAMTLSGLPPSKEYLFMRAAAIEARNNDFPVTANYAEINIAIADTGTTGTSIQADGEFRILTGTGDTSDPAAIATGRDFAQTYLALEEVVQ